MFKKMCLFEHYFGEIGRLVANKMNFTVLAVEQS